MIKKILMAIGVLAIVAVISIVGISYYVGNKIETEIEKRVPELRQYVTMTPEEQNAYVDKSIDEIYSDMVKLIGDDSDFAEFQAAMKNLNDNLELRQAKINWGRSVIAKFILGIEDIRKDLRPEVLKNFQNEDAEYEVRMLEYKKQINMQKLQD